MLGLGLLGGGLVQLTHIGSIYYVITYLDGLNASSPIAEYFIEVSFASFANRPAT